MSRHVVKRPQAIRDLDEVAGYLQAQSGPKRAIRFLRDADSLFDRLASMPGTGTRYEPDDPIFADLRVAPLSRFKNHLVFYRPLPGGIEVLRVLHGARNIRSILADDIGVGAQEDEEAAEGTDEP